jgi:hypothetical protein
MMRWLRSLFAWRFVRVSGIWEYEENAVTGARRASNWCRGGYSPLDWHWLLAGNGMPRIDGVAAWRSAYRNSLPDGMYWA